MVTSRGRRQEQQSNSVIISQTSQDALLSLPSLYPSFSLPLKATYRRWQFDRSAFSVALIKKSSSMIQC